MLLLVQLQHLGVGHKHLDKRMTLLYIARGSIAFKHRNGHLLAYTIVLIRNELEILIRLRVSKSKVTGYIKLYFFNTIR